MIKAIKRSIALLHGADTRCVGCAVCVGLQCIVTQRPSSSQVIKWHPQLWSTSSLNLCIISPYCCSCCDWYHIAYMCIYIYTYICIYTMWYLCRNVIVQSTLIHNSTSGCIIVMWLSKGGLVILERVEGYTLIMKQKQINRFFPLTSVSPLKAMKTTMTC